MKNRIYTIEVVRDSINNSTADVFSVDVTELSDYHPLARGADYIGDAKGCISFIAEHSSLEKVYVHGPLKHTKEYSDDSCWNSNG